MSRRGATNLSGILIIDKPAGMTSHDVLSVVRKATGEKRIGHAGTLDPMATGLLVVLVGPATRLAPYLSSATKRYLAKIEFGSATDTDDAEGQPVSSAPCPPGLFDHSAAQSILDSFLGSSMQVPPQYSAIKVEGRTAHRVSRAGGEIQLAPRPIEVSEARLLGTDSAKETWDVEFLVSKGTYVRALARDIAVAAGTVAHLSALRRTASGVLNLADHACALDDVIDAASSASLPAYFVDPVEAMSLPLLEADPETVRNGRRLPPIVRPGAVPDSLFAVTDRGRLLAVYRATPDALVAQTVIPGGVSGGSRP